MLKQNVFIKSFKNKSIRRSFVTEGIKIFYSIKFVKSVDFIGNNSGRTFLWWVFLLLISPRSKNVGVGSTDGRCFIPLHTVTLPLP